MIEVNAPTIGGVSDLFTFVDSVTNGLFTLSVLLAVFIITYLTILQSTKSDKEAMLGALFMTFFSSVMWGLGVGNPVAIPVAIVSIIGIVVVGRFM